MTHHQNLSSSALETFPENLLAVINNLRRVRLHESLKQFPCRRQRVQNDQRARGDAKRLQYPCHATRGSVACSCSTFATNAQVSKNAAVWSPFLCRFYFVAFSGALL